MTYQQEIPSLKIGRCVRYRVADLHDWAERKTQVADGSPDNSPAILTSMRHEWYVSEIVIDVAQDMGDLRPATGAGGMGKAQMRSTGGK